MSTASKERGYNNWWRKRGYGNRPSERVLQPAKGERVQQLAKGEERVIGIGREGKSERQSTKGTTL